METPFTITPVTLNAWEAAGVEGLPDYEALASMAHDLSVSIGEQLGIMGPDTWMELPSEVRMPLTVFAKRIVEVMGA